ncbi:MAG: ABC transporter ATP-binding protein [Candidatus Competibacteraceae bacterium]|nr:ABC transporter ATP-binding protein [Candidatus Competibacteraceae bacterium]MBK8898310.1 ABC transporter ATP-binding protein [Candidatus Competibacteraceae bacterium]MBK8962117.1 ABC transporter ATP-binding protein [Candidatus Competibacteraceae bacterium]MBK9951329.1 ABC transporter ATP-binding protein [Candidatus Competibacteraceae bacterium]
MTALLEACQLVKHFRGVKAVDGLDLAISTGRCFGLLGPNGAGKTTTVELLEGIQEPTRGVIRYRGERLGARFRQDIGIMFQSTALQDFITGRENLRMFGSLYRRTLPVAQLIEDCALGGFIDRDSRKLSGGQRQRLLLAIALVNDPELIFLDEPTTGLDPQARRNFWELVQRIKARGKTLLLTTHYMEEAYHLCDEVAIMDHGRIIAQGTPRELLAAHFDDVVLQLPQADFSNPPLSPALTVIQTQDSVEILTRDVNAAIEELLAHHISLRRLQIRPRTLEDLFLELTGRELRT